MRFRLDYMSIWSRAGLITGQLAIYFCESGYEWLIYPLHVFDVSVEAMSKQASMPGKPFEAWRAAVDIYSDESLEIPQEPILPPSIKLRRALIDESKRPSVPQV